MENLHPKDSLAIIEAVINQRKQKYEENGIFLIFWGILVTLAGIGQFLMLKMNFYPLNCQTIRNGMGFCV